MKSRLNTGAITKTPLLSKLRGSDFNGVLQMSRDYEKDTFSFFAEGFELSQTRRIPLLFYNWNIGVSRVGRGAVFSVTMIFHLNANSEILLIVV